MAAMFDRMEFVRALRDKPGVSLPPETVEALADALHAQQRMAGCAGLTIAFLWAAKFFS